MASSCSSSLRLRLQTEVGVRFWPSQRADLQARLPQGTIPNSSWAQLWQESNWLYARYHDACLLSIGSLDEQPCSRLARDFRAPCSAPVESDLRPLWLDLDQLQSSAGAAWAKPLAARLERRLRQVYQGQALLGVQEALRGYPRLGQLAHLWGGLHHWEATCKI